MVKTMQIRLEKLTFKTFTKNINEMFDLLDTNRDRLSPWFWWANKKTTPNKYKFALFMALYLMGNKNREIIHNINPNNLYDEQFFVFNEYDQIGGMLGLDNIDTQNKKNAEIWGLAFKGNTQTIEATKILEDYCINTLNLKSIYGKVQSGNRASRLFWEKYGYDYKIIEDRVKVSRNNPLITTMYTYTKILSK